MTDPSDAREALGQHIIAHCREGADHYHSTVPDDVGVDWDDWTIESVDECPGGVIEVHATQSATQSVQVRSATYNPPSKAHPAEYENHDVTITVVARADWSDRPLAGECSLDLMIRH